MNASNWGNLPLLWLLLVVPVLVVAYSLDGQRRRRVLEQLGHLPMIRRMTASWSPGARRWRAILTVTAVTLLVTALARPQVQGKGRLTENRGLDLVVALDFSRSMLASDVYPSRLERAKAELAHLIDTLKGDRVGLVAFAGETMSYPLTVDYEAAKLFWRDLQPNDMPVGGTDLGRAITASLELLKSAREAEVKRRPEAKRRPAQVILLLTDGEDTEGRGLAAAHLAASQGVRIYTLGIGSGDKALVQLYDEEGRPAGTLSDEDGQAVQVGLDAAGLKSMAQVTGGEYLAVDPHRFGVERVQKAIAELERTEEEARFEREPDDIGRFLLLPGFLLLVLSALVRERRRVPAETTLEASPLDGAREPSSPQLARPSPSPSPSSAQRQVAALLFLLLFPFVSGFDLLLRRDPNIEEGNQQLQAGKPAEALKAYDRAAEAMPDEPIVRFDRGAALYQLGRFPEAQKEFQRATEGHDPALKADAWYNMGNALFKQERWKESLDAYKHVLGLRPEDRRAKWNLELALKRLREEKQKQQQQQQSQDQKDQKDQKDQQQQAQQQKDQKDPKDQKDQQQQAQQQKDQQQKQQEQQQQQAQPQQAQNEEQKDGKQPPPPTPNESPERGEKDKPKAALAKKEPPRDIDKQDAEAVLDALERVEPTVQKDLARRRAGNRRATKDW